MCLSIVVSQFIYILYYLGSRRNMISFTTFDQLKEGISAFVMVCMAGYLLYLLVEAPFSNILTEFVTKKRSKEKRAVNDLLNHHVQPNEPENQYDFVKQDANNNSIRDIVQKELAEEKKIN